MEANEIVAIAIHLPQTASNMWITCGSIVKTDRGYTQESTVTPMFPCCVNGRLLGILEKRAKAPFWYQGTDQ